jgi:hypothetical protein
VLCVISFSESVFLSNSSLFGGEKRMFQIIELKKRSEKENKGKKMSWTQKKWIK